MILIVDEKNEDVFLFKNILETQGFIVDVVDSEEEALKKVYNREYTVIIFNVQQLHIDEFLVTESLRDYSKSKSIPIIFLVEQNAVIRFIDKENNLGIVDLITKPIHPAILELKVNLFYKIHEQKTLLIDADRKLKKEITYRKQAQIELKNRIQYLHTIFNSIPQVVFKVDNKGNVTFVNEQWYEYSSSSHSFPEQDIQFIPIKQLIQENLTSKKEFQYELRIKNVKSGVFRFHLLRVIPVILKERVIKWVGTFTDIEEQKQVENKKDEFLSIASHELKTPLTSVKGYVQLLGRQLPIIENENVSNLIEKTHNQVLKLENLVIDLLDFSQVNSSKLLIVKDYFDLDALVNNVILTIELTFKSANIKILREGEYGFDKVFGDVNRIEQVLINFLTNAIKYSPGSDKIIISCKVVENKLWIEVEDFGIGIPDEKKEHIFNKFYRVDEASVRFQGLGIGLFICSEIIKQHNGTYGVLSKKGLGTRVFFTIPY